MRVVFFATLLLLFQLGACFDREGEVTLVSESEPLTVKVDPGSAVIDWIWFQGPRRNVLVNGPEPPPLEDPKDVIVWQITPRLSSQDREFSSPDKFPVIAYGQVPEGWEQQAPATGSPPPLLDGYVYSISVITFRSPRPRALCVYLKNGRLERYVDNEDALCKE
jgi:hypothetical protein